MKGNVWGPKQRIPVEEAIRVGTLNGAYDSYEFFLNGPTHADIYTLSLHDALPISQRRLVPPRPDHERRRRPRAGRRGTVTAARDRKSTRLNSSHMSISYAVFCLKKKNRKLRART